MTLHNTSLYVQNIQNHIGTKSIFFFKVEVLSFFTGAFFKNTLAAVAFS